MEGTSLLEFPPATILVVEDELMIRLWVADHLREGGFRVLEAATAGDAMAIVKREKDLRLMFTDVRLGGLMGGFSLVRWVRQKRPDVRVVLGSGDAKKIAEARHECEDVPLFEKPYDLDLLAGHIRQALEAPSGV
jgi:DNA-binding NtrC family response regulator